MKYKLVYQDPTFESSNGISERSYSVKYNMLKKYVLSKKITSKNDFIFSNIFRMTKDFEIGLLGFELGFIDAVSENPYVINSLQKKMQLFIGKIDLTKVVSNEGIRRICDLHIMSPRPDVSIGFAKTVNNMSMDMKPIWTKAILLSIQELGLALNHPSILDPNYSPLFDSSYFLEFIYNPDNILILSHLGKSRNLTMVFQRYEEEILAAYENTKEYNEGIPLELFAKINGWID